MIIIKAITLLIMVYLYLSSGIQWHFEISPIHTDWCLNPDLLQLYSPFHGFWHHLVPLQWRHNGHDTVWNHQPHDCLLNRLFRRRSKKTSTLRVTGLCVGNSPGTGEFPAQMASNAENVSIWWRQHAAIGPILSMTSVDYEVSIFMLQSIWL